ncbi:hypothetical protein ACOMHN_053824 [Nucella lapillus]
MADEPFTTEHQKNGYPRFVINNYAPFAPFLPTAADTLPTLLPPGPGVPQGADPAHYHRIYELQKDAFLASVAASQSLYGILPTSHPFLDQTASPLQQQQLPGPPGPPALPLGVVKQEPRDSRDSGSCAADRSSSSSKASEQRRHHSAVTATPRLSDSSSRRDCSREAASSGAGNNVNNNNSTVNLNNSGSKSQSVHRTSGVKGQGRDKKEAVKSSARGEHTAATPSSKDKRAAGLCVAGAKASTDKPTDPALYKATVSAAAGSSLSAKADSGKRPETASAASLKSPKSHATKSSSSHGPLPSKVSCGSGSSSSRDSPHHRVSGCKTVALPPPKTQVDVAGKAGSASSSRITEGKVPASSSSSSARAGVKGRDHSTTTITTTSSTIPVDSPKKASAHDKGGERPKDGAKGSGGANVSLQPEDWPPPPPPKTSPGSDASRPKTTTVSTVSSGALTSSSSPIVTTGGASVASRGGQHQPQAVPTLVTLTSTPCDVSTVTSLPVTSGGTQSVFARSQPVSSSSVTGAPAAQLKNSSVTSQVAATSVLPYYHTLYSKAEGGEQGAVGVKKVQATTTFVPEVGTFKGPLIRNMPKGCPEGRAVKSEQPRSSACCREESQASKSGPGLTTTEGDVSGHRSEGSHGKGAEDEASDLSLSSASGRHSHGEGARSQSVSLVEERHQHHPPDRQDRSAAAAEKGFPAKLEEGVCRSSSPSSVPFPRTKMSSVPCSGGSDTVLSEEDSGEVALDYSMSRRSKEFSDVSKCHEDRQAKASSSSDKSSGSISGSKGGLKRVSSRSVSSAASTSSSACVSSKTCPPGPRSDNNRDTGSTPVSLSSSASSSSSSSVQMTRGAGSSQTTSQQGPTLPSAPTQNSDSMALNLSQSLTKKKPSKDAKTKRTSGAAVPVTKSVETSSSHHVTGSGSRVSQLLASEKRCGSAPPRAGVVTPEVGTGQEEQEKVVEEEEEEEEELPGEMGDKDGAEHTGSNIPVGIAVAQQRADGGRVEGRPAGVGRGEHALRSNEDTVETPRQLAHFTERDDFLRQQKSVLTGAAKPIPNTGLPPNLVVTGGDNSLTEELRLRPLASQWLAAAGHGLAAAANPWLSAQNPFGLHPAAALPPPTTATTAAAAFDPSHQPGVALAGGFKLAQDSLTGQLLIIPSGAELVDQNALWPAAAAAAFQSGGAPGSQTLAPSVFPPPLPPTPQHAPITTVPSSSSSSSSSTPVSGGSGNANGEESTTQLLLQSASASAVVDVAHLEENVSVCEESSEGQQTPEQAQQQQQQQQLAAFSRDRPAPPNAVVSLSNNGVTDGREKGEGVTLNNAFVPDLTAAHSLALQAAAAAAAAAGITTPQFPFVFSPALLPLPSVLPVGEALNIKTETPSVQSRGCSPIIMSPTPSELDAAGEERVTEGGEGRKQVSTACASVQTGSDLEQDPTAAEDPRGRRKRGKRCLSWCREQGVQTSLEDHLQPLSVICATPELQDLHKDTAPLGALAAAAMVAESKGALRRGGAGRGGAREGAGGLNYNPFTDPQILQAADGLELLSTLAEKRPKCSSSAALVDPKAVFPSPSDSFKSDTPLPCPELEEGSSQGEGERSGGTTPRGDRPRDVSPKWGPPGRREAGSTAGAGPDFKSSSTNLVGMDAIELDMRIRLAELQRQYREKQRELAKFQPKKDKDVTDVQRMRQQQTQTVSEDLTSQFLSRLRNDVSCALSTLQAVAGDVTALKDRVTALESAVEKLLGKCKVEGEFAEDLRDLAIQDGVKRGRGRPRKRQFVAGKNDDESSNSSGSKTIKEASVKRRRPAEELVDRVFRKLPPAKLGKLKVKPMSLKHKKTRPSHTATTQLTDGARETGKKKSKHRHDTGNLFTNLESSFAKSSAKKKMKRQSEIPATITSGLSSATPTTITPVSLESGLGLLAKFATSTTTPSTTFSGACRRRGEEGGVGPPPWDPAGLVGGGDTTATPLSFGTSPGHSPLNKRRESDTDNSDTANGTCSKKRKPGRPRKCDPNKTTGFTETIWARQSGLLQLSDVAQGKSWVSKAEEAATASTPTTSTTPATHTVNYTPFSSSSSSSSSAKLAASQGSSLSPLLLDEWNLRRSERIFLSDTSPQPSPNLQSPAKDSSAGGKAPGPKDSRSSSSGSGRPAGAGGRGRPPGTGYKQLQRANSLKAEMLRQQSSSPGGTRVREREPGSGSPPGLKRKGTSRQEDGRRGDRDRAKVQKARSLQELSQRVKKKYSNRKLVKKNATAATAGAQEDRKRRRARTEKAQNERAERTEKEEESSSEGDNVPLSALRERAVTPEPRSCVIRQEELQEGLNVLFFKDCLFYEGQVQAIQPPDIYGVVVAGQRGTRPHICSREEILKDAIMAVAPGTQRYVKEGTRVCAYWSQQFRCLYPGTVAKTSPNPHNESSVNVEFDDGDSGRIPISHIRLLPQDFPLVTEEPDPLFYPTKKRRRTISEEDLHRNADDRSSISGYTPARKTARSHTVDDIISDDGSVFDSASLISSTSGKSASHRGRPSKDDPKARRKEKGKEAWSGSSSKPGTSSSGKKATHKDDEEDSESEEEVEEEDSEEDYSSQDDDDDSSSSEDGKKSKVKDSGRKSGRGRKKKGNRLGGGASRMAWRWAGPSTKRPGMRGKAKKEFYKSIARGSDTIHPKDRE